MKFTVETDTLKVALAFVAKTRGPNLAYMAPPGAGCLTFQATEPDVLLLSALDARMCIRVRVGGAAVPESGEAIADQKTFADLVHTFRAPRVDAEGKGQGLVAACQGHGSHEFRKPPKISPEDVAFPDAPDAEFGTVRASRLASLFKAASFVSAADDRAMAWIVFGPEEGRGEFWATDGCAMLKSSLPLSPGAQARPPHVVFDKGDAGALGDLLAMSGAEDVHLSMGKGRLHLSAEGGKVPALWIAVAVSDRQPYHLMHLLETDREEAMRFDPAAMGRALRCTAPFSRGENHTVLLDASVDLRVHAGDWEGNECDVVLAESAAEHALGVHGPFKAWLSRSYLEAMLNLLGGGGQKMVEMYSEALNKDGRIGKPVLFRRAGLDGAFVVAPQDSRRRERDEDD